MSSKIKLLIGLGIFVVFIIASFVIYNNLTEANRPSLNAVESENETDKESTERTDDEDQNKVKALDFTVLDASGEEVMLSEMYGKPIVMNFWASWCPPCKDEMPEFEMVYNELGSEVQFVMVNMTSSDRETIENGKSFIEEEGFTFPVFYDVNGEVFQLYAVTAIPATYFIDKDGYIVTGAQGQIDERMLRKGIEMIR